MVTSAALNRPVHPHSAPRLAIVIPTLDEASVLSRHLAAARPLGDQVIVSDGGSRDGTLEIARAAGVTLVEGSAGRGQQLNRGARACEAEILLFLHADTTLPPDSARQIRRVISEGAVGGGFQVQFDSPRRIFRLGDRIVAWRTLLSSTPLGDQAQFVRADVFDRMGGFRNWPILEDLDFARRLKKEGPVHILPGPATTAARRYLKQGITRTIVTNWLIWILFFLGVSPHRLARWYRRIR